MSNNIIKITDFTSPELDIYARLNEAQLLHLYEPHGGVFLAESPMIIERALDRGYEPVSFLMERKHIDTAGKEILQRCENVPIYTAEYEVLTKLTGFQLTRGMVCAMKRKAMLTLEEICQGASRIVILEDVVNPTNVGAIFRSAAALNMDGIILTKACSDPLYRRALRVSMGTVFQIPWTILDKEDWPEKTMADLHKIGFKMAAMALKDDSVSIDDSQLKSEEKLAIILGTEGEGLKDSTIEACDYTVRIPMSHGVDSLNVAAASAVAFWELKK